MVRLCLSRSRAATKRFARTVLRDRSAVGRHPLILALMGELGSGKTTFIQGLTKALGVREKVQSPTFVLMKWYRLPKRVSPFRHFVHVDAYRLESLAEAKHLGLREIFRDHDVIVAIEWADRIRKLIPRNAIWLHFRHGQHVHERIVGLKVQSVKSQRKAQKAKVLTSQLQLLTSSFKL